MDRHQKDLVIVHKQQLELEQRLKHAYSTGTVPRPVATQLQLQLDRSSAELDLAEQHFRELERHYLAARNELAESHLRADELEAQVVSLQDQLSTATQAAHQAAQQAAEEQRQLQAQLQQQQQQLDSDKHLLDSLQHQAALAKDQLSTQQEAASLLQQQLTATESAKAAAEQRSATLAAQLAEMEQEMSVLAHAQAETEQVAAQVAADLAAAREWAYANAARFVEVQKQLGAYQADLQDTQEDLRLTHQKLQAVEAQQAAVGQELAVTKEQLAAEQAAHGNTNEQLTAARSALDKIKCQYLSTRDQLEAERVRRMQLQRTVAGLKERLVSLRQLREQQHEVAAAERAKWEAQVAEGRKEHDEAKAALEALQQEYFSAYDRLDAEQQRVGTLESIVGQLEDRMDQLSAAALAAPAVSAFEVGGGPAAELVVASNALHHEWKGAQAALATSRHIMGTLELEYKDARAAVDHEHQRYAQAEASLEFLQERLAAAEQAGAGEAERYQHTTAELHEQLEQQANSLVECQLRIANLTEELEASRQRLEDEQVNEAELTRRAQQLEAETAAASQQLEQAGVDAVGHAVPAQVHQQLQAAATDAPDASAADSAVPSRWESLIAALEEQKRQQQQQQGTILQQHASSSSSVSHAEPTKAAELQQLQDSEAAAGAAAGSPSYEAMDMSAVRRHVEEMAAQYVEKLSMAEAELHAVRSVWQQAEDELAALRHNSPRGSSSDNGGSSSSINGAGSPRWAGAAEAVVGAAAASAEVPAATAAAAANGSKRMLSDFELVRRPPVNAPEQVSGSSHAGAEAELSFSSQPLVYMLELPSPEFGGGHIGNFPPGHKGARTVSSNSGSKPAAAAAAVGSNTALLSDKLGSPVVPSPSGLVGLKGAAEPAAELFRFPKPPSSWSRSSSSNDLGREPATAAATGGMNYAGSRSVASGSASPGSNVSSWESMSSYDL